jgi:nucleoside-diphosphate-sugar epimerase
MPDHRTRILVAGGAGFIGAHLVTRLLAEGHLVGVPDNMSTGTPPANLAPCYAAGLVLAAIDLEDGGVTDLDHVSGVETPRPMWAAPRFPDSRLTGFYAATCRSRYSL